MSNNHFSPETYFDLTDFPFAGIFSRVTNVWEILPQIGEFIKKTAKSLSLEGSYDEKSKIFIGKGTEIKEGVLILGPAIIGTDCFISHNAFVRANCILGNNVHVGHSVEIKNSVILNNAKIAHFNYVGDSVIGNSMNMGGGAKIANYRLDKKPIIVKSKDEVYDTGLQKFGAIVGDNASIGANAVLNPGTILGKGTIVYPLTSVTGVYEHEAVIR